MHLFFYYHIKVLIPSNLIITLTITSFLVFMLVAPVLCYIFNANNNLVLARITAWVGYSWMGFIFLAFWTCLGLSFLHSLFWIFYKFNIIQTKFISGKSPILIILTIVVSLCIYGYFEANNIKTKHIVITTNKLPANIDSLTIAQISDLHLGLLTNKSKLKKIIETIDSEKPDLLVSTGDFVDRGIQHFMELANHWQTIQPRYGKFAVTGNHEHYVGLKKSYSFIKQAGFYIVHNEIYIIEGLINIIGLADSYTQNLKIENVLLNSVHNDLFTLYLKHRPTIKKQLFGSFDLQLSGHTHGGQIFPGTFFIALRYPLINGYHHLGNGSDIYISQGIGCWGPQIRLLSSPQLSIIKLTTS